MVNKTFKKSIPNKDFELMNKATVYEVESKNQANNKRSRGNSEDLKSNDSYDDDGPPPPSKKQKSGFKSVITTSHEETMTIRTMKIMMMTLMKMKNMMVMTMTRMTMIKYDKNENE
jgi:hypothetical protein